MEFLMEELKLAKENVKLAEEAFNEADSENIDYAIHNLNNARMKLNLVFKNIRERYEEQ